MKTNKEYRFVDNPKEKEFHDKFIEEFKGARSEFRLSAILFGCEDGRQAYPKKHATEDEMNACLNIIQWLGSPVGQIFLRECGFELKNK